MGWYNPYITGQYNPYIIKPTRGFVIAQLRFFGSSLLAPDYRWEFLGAHLISGLDRLSGPSNQVLVSNDMNLVDTWKIGEFHLNFPQWCNMMQFIHSNFFLKKMKRVSFPASNFCLSSTPPHIQIPEKIGARRPDSPQTHKMLTQGDPAYPTNLPGSVADKCLQAYGPVERLISLTLLAIKGSTEKDRFGQGHCAIQGSIYRRDTDDS